MNNLEIGIGNSQAIDSHQAGKQAVLDALSQIRQYLPSLVLVFASPHYDLQMVLDGIASHIGNTPIAGSSSAYEIANTDIYNNSVTVVIWASPYIKAKVGVGYQVSSDPNAAVEEAIKNSNAKSLFSYRKMGVYGSNSLSRSKVPFLIVFSPGSTKKQNSLSSVLLEELRRRSMNRLPIIGASSADNFTREEVYQFANGKVLTDSLVMVLVETELRFHINVAHGFRPTDKTAIVTKVDNNIILELDGKPAGEVYADMLKIPLENLQSETRPLVFIRYPLGLQDPYGDYTLRAPRRISIDNGLEFSSEISTNVVITLMEAEDDDLIEAAGYACKKAITGGNITNPSFFLVFSCAIRALFLKDRLKEEIKALLNVGLAPTAGFYTYGEQGVSESGVPLHCNESFAILVLGNDLNPIAQATLDNFHLLQELRKTNEILDQQLKHLKHIYRISDFIQRNIILGPEKILAMMLTAITAGEGYGFNRALFFDIDENRNLLVGKMGVGPLDGEEAHKIWENLHYKSNTLEELMDEAAKKGIAERNPNFNNLIKQISISLDRQRSGLVQVTHHKHPLRLSKQENSSEEDNELLSMLNVDEIAILPLISSIEGIYGILVADNFITRRPITDQDLQLLAMFCNQMILAIENAQLYEDLEDRMSRLKEAYKELQNMQKKLIQSERLAMIGEVTATVSHEIRNPLVSIGGFANRLHRQLKNMENASEDMLQSTKIIYTEVRRLEEIVEGSLELVRKPSPHREIISLNEQVNEILKFLDGEFLQLNINLRKNYQTDDIKVKVNVTQIRQVLLNILKNAIQVMPNGGTLAIVLRYENDEAILSITDTGAGMTEEQRKELFKPFYSTKEKGTGLGLAVSKKIIQDHKGRIQVITAPNIGSTFTICLPIYKNRE